jgi:hypothetical protein
MPNYVIEREIPGASNMTEEQVREVALKSLGVLKELGPQIQWLHSYVTDDKVYCIYWAPNEENRLKPPGRIARRPLAAWSIHASNWLSRLRCQVGRARPPAYAPP